MIHRQECVIGETEEVLEMRKEILRAHGEQTVIV
jgi:hypothetical protein